MPALEVPGPQEACRDGGEHDERREVPVQDTAPSLRAVDQTDDRVGSATQRRRESDSATRPATATATPAAATPIVMSAPGR